MTSVGGQLDDLINLISTFPVAEEEEEPSPEEADPTYQTCGDSDLTWSQVYELYTKDPATLTDDERVQLALSVAQKKECIQKDQLNNLMRKKFAATGIRPIAYDGFEPSGRMHIAQGILKAINVNKLTRAGCDFVFWVADWFALLNKKMGGDLQKIKDVGKYMVEIWKAAGMDMEHVSFKWASDSINENSNEYWLRVIDITKTFTVSRVKRCCTIMGRKSEESMPVANLMYAAMQCGDIFHLKADICQLGLDQRKVNMLAREWVKQKNAKPKSEKTKAEKAERLFQPVILSHHMLAGLKRGQEKMSKSHPDSAIFMEDSASDVKRKITKAYCPPGIVKGNPCMEYIKYIVFGWFGQFEVTRKPQNGGSKTYTTYEDLCEDVLSGALHPGDMKPSLAAAINSILAPVREHFQKDRKAKALLAKVKKYRVTR